MVDYGYGTGTGPGTGLGGGGMSGNGGMVMPSSTGAMEPAPTSMSIGGTMLPEQHEDQLQLGFRMIQNAYGSKVQNLENELRGLRLSCEEQKGQAKRLHQRNSGLEAELVEGHQRCQALNDENKELFKTVQNLQRQLQRLEGLKKKVLDTISDDANADYSAESEEARLAMRDDYLQSSLPLTMGSLQNEQNPSAKPPSPAPHNSWTSNRGLPAATAPGPSNSSSRAPSPPHASMQGQLQQPPQTPAVVDGKQFFRQARSQLSYEGFNEFLANIKRLNNQQQTREETLEEARRIFGPDLQNLYHEFEQLLSRQAV